MIDPAFNYAAVGGKLVAHGPEGGYIDFGYVPPFARSPEVSAACAASETKAAPFRISGNWQMTGPRSALWQAAMKVRGGRHLEYIWQLTGSCVGAGGENMRKTLMCVEQAGGTDPDEYAETWWPFTYGKSRQRSGMRGRGEGSTGTGWAEAATEDGSFSAAEPGLPAFRLVEGWHQLSESVEMQWSAGEAIDAKYVELGRKHLIKTRARAASSDDLVAAAANGYPWTLASMFGTRGGRVAGTPPVRLWEWDGSWSHQMYGDEAWDHPELGMIFRIGNNWGPGAHGDPVGDAPPGGGYVTRATMDRICRTGEVWIFSAFDGFPARTIKWFI